MSTSPTIYRAILFAASLGLALVGCVSDSGADRSGTPSQTADPEFGNAERARGDLAQPHQQSNVVDGAEIDWTDTDRPVVLHTYEESEATRASWKSLVADLVAENYAYRDPRVIGVAFDVPFQFGSDPELKALRDALTDLGAGETVFFGLGGPFAQERIHLFECGPGAGSVEGEGPVRAWRVGEVVVKCSFPALRYGIIVDPDNYPGKPYWYPYEYEYVDEHGRSTAHELRVERHPPIPGPYLEWWHSLRRAIVEKWHEVHMNLPDREYWERIACYVHLGPEADVEPRGARSLRKATLDSDLYGSYGREPSEHLDPTLDNYWEVREQPVIRARGTDFASD